MKDAAAQPFDADRWLIDGRCPGHVLTVWTAMMGPNVSSCITGQSHGTSRRIVGEMNLDTWEHAGNNNFEEAWVQ